MSTQPLTVFIIEDDPVYSEFLDYHISKDPDCVVEKYYTGKECLDNLYKRPSLITLDYTLPDLAGDAVLSKIKSKYPEIPVIIVSGQNDVNVAINLLKNGAFDYVVKDDDAKERIWKAIQVAKEKAALEQRITELEEEVENKYSFQSVLIGESPALKRVFTLMEKSIKTDITVSITGETGTGKEVVAKAIHYNSSRKKHPFVAVNVAAIPKDLIESELFGHEKGAFTGANNRRIGKFEEATKGTLFLDEIGEMELNMQAKLLRVLQEEEVTRIGGNSVIKLNTRIIVATHKNLLDEVRKGRFREDLYYRLLGLPIELPPLRDRGNDVLILSKFFMDEFCKKNKLNIPKIHPTAQKKLMSYHFPGNVRELKALIELAVVLCSNDEITIDDINFTTNTSFTNFINEETTLKSYTRKIVQHYMKRYQNDIKLVAQKLDIGVSSIYRMLKEGEIDKL